MAEHARYFQASSASRWMACPGSVKLCDGLPDTSSEYAEEGTRAHEVAAACLVGDDPPAVGIALPDDMPSAVLAYVDAVRAAAEGHPILVEQRVDFSHVLNEPNCFGTADAIVLKGDEIQIHDLKYGRGVKVEAENNPQLQLYALGALAEYGFLGDFKQARLFIHQPRLDHVSEWAVSLKELEAFGARAASAVEEALSPNPRFVPGESQCRFCKAKAHCPALAAHVAETVGADFEDLDAAQREQIAGEPERMGLNYLSHCMASIDLVEDWCKAIRGRVERELFAGNAVDGWKLVQGRKSARAWSSAEEAEAALKRMKLKVEDIYDLKLISPTSAEKLHKAGTIGPRQWPALQALITQTEGKPSVAPASDKRPAISPTVTADDFEEVS